MYLINLVRCIFRLNILRGKIIYTTFVLHNAKIESKINQYRKTCCPVEVQIQFNRTKSPLESVVNTLRGELFTDRRVKVPSVLLAVASAFWRVPGIFSHFSQVRGKSHQLPRFSLLHSQRTWWSDCNSTCRTDSCGETSKSSYNRTVARARRGQMQEKGWEKWRA